MPHKMLKSKNPQWKGDEVSYQSLHTWIRRNYKKPNICDTCKQKKSLDLANVSHSYNAKTYTRDIKNWKWLCRKCHMVEDGRIDELLERNRKNSKLTDKEVEIIITARGKTKAQELAMTYGVHKQHIYNIWSGLKRKDYRRKK